MSIETSIDNVAGGLNAIAAALNAIASAIAGKAVTAPVNQLGTNSVKLADKPADKVAEKKPAATASAATQPTAEVEKAAVQEKKAESSEEKTSPGSTTEIDFATQIQKPIVAMAGSGRRDVAMAILNKFGAKKASEIKPEDYAAAVAAIVEAG